MHFWGFVISYIIDKYSLISKEEKRVKNMDGCKYFKKCGACQLRNMTYEEQLSYKMSRVIKTLGRFCHIDEIVPMENPENYRNKAQAIIMSKGGKIVSGIYKSSSGTAVKCDFCSIETERAGKIIREITCIMNELKISAYDATSDKGFMRHVLVREGFATDQVMVVLVSRTPVFPKEKAFVSLLTERIPSITTIVHNVNDTATPLWLTDRERVLYGDGYITDILCGCTFRISARSFYQINPVQTERLYSEAISKAELTGREKVLDAYSGIGTIGIIAAKNAASVDAVETNKSSTADAAENARLSGVSNVRFFTSDTTRFMERAAARKTSYDAVFVDPPRAGCDKNFLSKLVTLAPKKIIYVSCNPDTLARDLTFLRTYYKIKSIKPFDMFPHTNHIECVVCLSLKDGHRQIKGAYHEKN